MVADDISLLQQACQQRLLRLLPIMDGWDELPPVKENLYLLSGFWEEERWPYLKVLSTCRPEAFVHYEKHGGYKSIFHPREGAGKYTILNLSAFESRHIDAYVDRYVSTLSEDYQPLISVPVPDAVAKQSRAWDQAKAAWCAHYEANYFPLPNSVKAADKTVKSVDEKEEEVAPAVDLNEERSMDWRSAQTYQYYFGHISGLSQLIQAPFILSAVIQVLPSIVEHQVQHTESQPSITRYTIYQYFVDYWLTAQAKRLWRDKEKQWDLIDFRMDNEEQSIAKLKACLFTYSENLACLALNLGGGKVEVNLSDQDTLNPNLVIPASGPRHFEKEEVEIKKLQLIRSACLLKNLGNTFKFLHKSLVEFFAAKTLFLGAHTAADTYLRRFNADQNFHQYLSLNEQLLTSEPNIIHLLADQAHHDLDFKYLLYQIIELSKGEPAVEKAAANAITILNAAGESFSGRDFRGIHIRGAILNGALCDQTDFEGADLRDVTAHNAWLKKANISHAQVSGLDFQELPRMYGVTSFCLASNGEWLLVGDGKGNITQRSYPQRKQLRCWNLKSPISSLALHPDEQLVAAGCHSEGIQLIHIQNSELGVCFEPPGMLKPTFFRNNYTYHAFTHTCITFCHTQGQYLACGIQVKFFEEYEVSRHYTRFAYDDGQPTITYGSREKYTKQHLQLWNVKEHCFLGEYNASHAQFKQLSACHQGCILIARTGGNILLFSIFDYTHGPLIPAQKLCSGDHFTLSRDERLLAVSEKNVIRFYQTHFCGPLSDVIQLKKGQKCEALAFSPEGNLLMVRSSTQLHLWDLSSGQHLYALPVPEGGMQDDWLPMHFSPNIDVLRVFVLIRNILYSWPLDRTAVSICHPRFSINLPTSLLARIKATAPGEGSELCSTEVSEGDSEFLSQTVSAQASSTVILERSSLSYEKKIYNIPEKKIRDLFKKRRCRWGWLNVEVENLELFFSTDKAYLVSISGWISEKRTLLIIYTHVWDLRRYRLHFTFTYDFDSNQDTYIYSLSIDEQYLVSSYENKIFIHRLKDGKKIAKFSTIYYLPTSIVLSADKHWLAVLDRANCLYIFDVMTQQCLYLNKLPIIIQKLDITVDSQFVIAESESGGALTFRIVQEKGHLSVQLVNRTMELYLVCDEINIEATHGLSQDNQLLLKQNNARGIPTASARLFSLASAPENKESEQKTDIEISRELSFDRAVVRRDNVSSFLNTRAVLNYDAWQVALVRDKESRSNSEHTFIVVEGMDAFGRCFFWRFDLVTRVGDAVVEKGFAKVNIQRYHDLLLSERESILQVFLNPHEIQGRGLESLVGHVWQLKREKVLELYKAIMADQAKGLLPYAITGNQSFFSTGDNCYSWSRRHLLALKEPKIEKELSSTSADYFAMRPKWKLQESLVAAQHAEREAASGPCRSM
jgi:WD40 repeat protein